MNQITRNDITVRIVLTRSENEVLFHALGRTQESWNPPKGIPSYDDVVRGGELHLTAENELEIMMALGLWRLGQSSAHKAAVTKVRAKIVGALDQMLERCRAEAQAKFDAELRKIASMRAEVERGFVAPSFQPIFFECYDRRHMEWSVEDTAGAYGHARRWDIRMQFSVVDGRPVVQYEVEAPMLSMTDWEHNRRVLCDSYEEMVSVVNSQAALFGCHLIASHLEDFEELSADLACLDAMAAATELVSA